MRAAGALLPEELALVEAWVKQVTGAKKLWTGSDAGRGAT